MILIEKISGGVRTSVVEWSTTSSMGFVVLGMSCDPDTLTAIHFACRRAVRTLRIRRRRLADEHPYLNRETPMFDREWGAFHPDTLAGREQAGTGFREAPKQGLDDREDW